MTLDAWVADALATAPVARLATVSGRRDVLLVPFCFAVLDGWIVSAVDHKPKRHGRLRRLDDIEASGRATVLVDHYDDDWSRLWWLRIAGRAEVDWSGRADVVDALATKYRQYRDHPPHGATYRIRIDELSSWRAAP